MTRAIFLCAALLVAACGSVTERDECSTSGSCALGEYCAHTSDGSVCWPDAVPAVVTGVTVGCGTSGCLRDGQLTVSAEVTDDKEVYEVEATVDVDPDHRFTLTWQTGTTWTGLISMDQVDFPALEREVVVTVRAYDGARNETAVEAEAGQRPVVTRVRWAYDSSGQLTAPAVASDGTVVFGRSDTTGQLVAVNPDGTNAWSLTLGSGTVTNAPSIGAQAIWVGANDGVLYAVKPDGSGQLSSPSRTCTASGAAKGPPAVLTTSGVDVAFQAFAASQIAASTSTTCVFTPPRDGYSSGAALDASGNVYAVTEKTSVGTLRSFSLASSAFEERWTAGVGGSVVAPLAFDAASTVLSGGKDAGLDRTTSAGVTGSVNSVSDSIVDSPIVLGNGDIVVGDASGMLHRLASDGTVVTGWPVDLRSAVKAPMALTGGPIRFLVATDDGKVHAIDEAGTVLWSGALASGIGAGNLHTPPGSAFSTAYFGGGDGKLYAVIVEGALDTSAPWPKAWHDTRNTSRAGGAF